MAFIDGEHRGQPCLLRRCDVAFVAGRAGARVVVLAASVGALPQTDDDIAIFDANVEARIAAASP